MNIWTLVAIVGGLGALGGLTRSLIGEGFSMWSYDRERKLWRPGWPGDIVVGAIAAVVFWGLYGTDGGRDVSSIPFTLTVTQAAGSVVLGISGSQVLKLLADRQADAVAKTDLTLTIQKLLRK